MEELDLNTYLFKQDLFELFKFQLIKDFESSGISIEFAKDLTSDLQLLKNSLEQQIKILEKKSPALLPILMYRIDISEAQIRKYSAKQTHLAYEALLAELIIKRVLQKVILKKTYSK